MAPRFQNLPACHFSRSPLPCSFAVAAKKKWHWRPANDRWGRLKGGSSFFFNEVTIRTNAHILRHPRALTKAEILVLLAIAVVLTAFFSRYLIPASTKARDEANLAQCKENLRQLGIALLAYAHDNHDSLPVTDTLDGPHPELTHTFLTSYLKDANPLYCPGLVEPAPQNTPANIDAGTIGYFYYAAENPSNNSALSRFLLNDLELPRETTTKDNPATWLMSDLWYSGQPTSHAGFRKGVNYLTLDGAVNFLTESPRKSFR